MRKLRTGLDLTLSSDSSNTINAATKLVFGQQPSGTGTSTVISPSVTVLVKDSNGTTVTNSSAPVTIALTSGSGLSGTLTRNAVNGVATFNDLTPTIANIYSLTATSSGLTPTVSVDFAVGIVLAQDLFNKPDSTLTNSTGYTLDVPQAMGAFSVNLFDPRGMNNTLNAIDGTGWHQHISQFQIINKRMVVGGSNIDGSHAYDNEAEAFLGVGATDVILEARFQWRSVDGTYSSNTDVNYVGGLILSCRCCPGGVYSSVGYPDNWDNGRITFCNLDGKYASIYQYDASISNFYTVSQVLYPLSDSQIVDVVFSTIGSTGKLWVNGVLLCSGTLSAYSPSLHHIYAGVELFAPGNPAIPDPHNTPWANGPLPLSSILQFKTTTAGSVSSLKDAVVNWEGDFEIDLAGRYLIHT